MVQLVRPRSGLLAPAAAAAAAVVAIVSGWRGVDLAAHIYAVGLFRREGLTLWDGRWFGGHWTLGYTVLYSPVAATVGWHLTAVASAGAAAWAFDRLVVEHYGTRARTAAVVFAVGTVAQVAIGQLPFLLGEAFGLAALLAASRRRWVLGAVLALAASLSSPLAGAFAALAAVAWLLTTKSRERTGPVLLLAAALLPLLVLQGLFPQGTMPYTSSDFVVEIAVFAALAALIPRTDRVLRTGAILYVVAMAVSFVVPTAMGGNIVRLGGCVAVPLAICAVEGRRQRQLAVLLLVPITVITWTPVWASATTGRSSPSTRPAYYAPLLSYLRGHSRPMGRVEIVPTALHWEVAYVAPSVPLARGSERQLDSTDNPLFYRADALHGANYLDWLRENGVRFVALSDAQIDYSGLAERRLLATPPAGLKLVWHSIHWRVFEVVGASGIVSGPGQLLQVTHDALVVQASHAGSIVAHVRPANRWVVTRGRACLRSAGGALVIEARGPGTIVLTVVAFPPTDAETDAAGC